MHRFLVVIEKADGNYSAYCPDLPGCIATGDTSAETEANMYEALQLHIEGMTEDGEAIPESTALAEYMVVA
jgi:predicted RNase H-like HicB family nuclease